MADGRNFLEGVPFQEMEASQRGRVRGRAGRMVNTGPVRPGNLMGHEVGKWSGVTLQRVSLTMIRNLRATAVHGPGGVPRV